MILGLKGAHMIAKKTNRPWFCTEFWSKSNGKGPRAQILGKQVEQITNIQLSQVGHTIIISI